MLNPFMTPQKRAERTYRLHELVVEALVKRPDQVRQQALKTLARWKELGAWGRDRERWAQILNNASLSELISIILEKGEAADELRRSAPFPGVITEDQRREVFRTFSDSKVN